MSHRRNWHRKQVTEAKERLLELRREKQSAWGRGEKGEGKGLGVL